MIDISLMTAGPNPYTYRHRSFSSMQAIRASPQLSLPAAELHHYVFQGNGIEIRRPHLSPLNCVYSLFNCGHAAFDRK